MWIVRCLAALMTVPALLAAVLAAFSAAPAAAGALRADGTRFELRLPDGRRLHSHELVGARLQLGSGHWVRIDSAERERDSRGQDVWLHRLSVRDADGAWQPLCLRHADGTAHALLVPGRERADGSVDDDEARFVISCTAGAQAKCVRFGYRPWEPGLRATYNACIRMVRGDYGGDGVAYTENGRLIDVYDALRIQTPDMAAEQSFEAGWDERGAVCVHHPRVAANATLDALRERYPRLADALGTACTEALARQRGALVFNRSKAP